MTTVSSATSPSALRKLSLTFELSTSTKSKQGVYSITLRAGGVEHTSYPRSNDQFSKHLAILLAVLCHCMPQNGAPIASIVQSKLATSLDFFSARTKKTEANKTKWWQVGPASELAKHNYVSPGDAHWQAIFQIDDTAPYPPLRLQTQHILPSDVQFNRSNSAMDRDAVLEWLRTEGVVDTSLSTSSKPPPIASSVTSARPSSTTDKYSSGFNSRSLRKRSEDAWQRYFRDCDIVASAPGSVFFAGEKVAMDGGESTSIKIPRRVYVGLVLRDSVNGGVCFSSCFEGFASTKAERRRSVKFTQLERTKEAFDIMRWASEQLTGQHEPISECRVWSEWQGESGLGWSGSFCVAAATALQGVHSGLNRSDLARWPNSLADKPFKDTAYAHLFKVAIMGETLLHGGRAGPASVAASSIPTPLFVHTSLAGQDLGAQWPPLWNKDVQTRNDLAERRANCLKDWFTRALNDAIDQDVCRIDTAVRRAGLDPRNAAERWEALFDDRVTFQVIDTQTFGSTALAAIREHTSQDITYEALAPIRSGLAQLSKQVAAAADAVVANSHTTESWRQLCSLTNRVRGCLTALGFGFPKGERLAGLILDDFHRHWSTLHTDDHTAGAVGIKPTGKAIAGCLLACLLDPVETESAEASAKDPKQVTGDLIKCYRASLPFALMYEPTRDGPEIDGARFERTPKDVQ